MTGLPSARACTAGRALELKVDTQGIGGWWTACEAVWRESTDGSVLSAALTEPGEATAFALDLRVQPSGDLLVAEARLAGPLWGHRVALPIPAGTTVPKALCRTSFVGDVGDVEYDNGRNNNGCRLDIEHPFLSVAVWPKREDRIRIDIRQAGRGQWVHVELDTRE